MNPEIIQAWISQNFESTHAIEHAGNVFFHFKLGAHQPDDLYFATLVTSDLYDQASDLSREGVFRLNLGLEKATFRQIFGEHAWKAGADGILETGHDYTRLDTLLPHPYYGSASWASILSPSEARFEQTLKVLITEAHAKAARKFQQRQMSQAE